MTMGGAPLEWISSCIPETRLTIQHLASRTAGIAVRALLREAEAGPKPGLVDRFGPGVHTDMDIRHFRLSAVALEPFFQLIFIESALYGASLAQDSPGKAACSAELAEALRNLGLQAEAAMLKATGGVNTHKGAIWTIGLLCAAIGILLGNRSGDDTAITLATAPGCFKAEAVCNQAASLARHILSLGTVGCPVTNPLANPSIDLVTNLVPTLNAGSVPLVAATKGRAVRQAYRLRSARDEALEGFPSIRALALRLARNLRNTDVSEDEKVISILLTIMCHADDTCIVARGGLPALQWVRSAAEQVLDHGGPFSREGDSLYQKMLAGFKAASLSPGGSADLCAATLFLVEIEVEGCSLEKRLP